MSHQVPGQERNGVDEEEVAPSDRRAFLSVASSIAMAGGLTASYGTFAAMAGCFLYPAGSQAKGWVYVTDIAAMKAGDSLVYRSPVGNKIVIAKLENGEFLALSGTCPHLGCQVHWEPQNRRFFCPCHNGVFEPTGKATDGPPAKAGQSLARYPLKVENGLLFIEVPLERVADAAAPRQEFLQDNIQEEKEVG